MGVAGAGKTVVGAELARALGVDFVDGDDYHPPANVQKMAAGIPLTDADRAEWLRVLAARIRAALDAGGGAGLVVACSALKRAYRDRLRAGAGAAAPELRFIFLRGSRDLIAERLAARRGHYMPVALLDSQFATLEEPSPDEHAWVCDVRQAPQEIVAQLVSRASRSAAPSESA